jgi:hypothetical protein
VPKVAFFECRPLAYIRSLSVRDDEIVFVDDDGVGSTSA